MVPRKYSDIIDELTERIRRYYGAFNVCAFDTLQGFVALDVLNDFKDNEFLANKQRLTLSRLRDITGRIEVIDVVMDIHIGEKSPTYGGRDYATGMTKWKDEQGKVHFFKECWVRGDISWFTLNMIPKG